MRVFTHRSEWAGASRRSATQQVHLFAYILVVSDLARASKAEELIWTGSRTLNVANDERGIAGTLEITGSSVATGAATWQLFAKWKGVQVFEERDVTGGEHLGEIDAMFSSFLERLPDYVARFFV